GLHGGGGAALGGQRVVQVGARDEFGRRQLARAIGVGLGVGVVGLRLRQRGLGGAQRGLQRGRIDQEQHVAFLDVAAFLVHALLQHARDARAHVRAAEAGQAAADLTRQRQVGGAGLDHAHFRRRRLGRRLFATAGGEQAQRKDERQGGGGTEHRG